MNFNDSPENYVSVLVSIMNEYTFTMLKSLKRGGGGEGVGYLTRMV